MGIVGPIFPRCVATFISTEEALAVRGCEKVDSRGENIPRAVSWWKNNAVVFGTVHSILNTFSRNRVTKSRWSA